MAETGHHSTNQNVFLVPLSIVLASLIISGSILFASNSMATKGAAITNVAGNLAAQGSAPNPNPSPSPAPIQAPQPAGGTVQLADTMKDAAATRGEPNAQVVVVEYSDYQCPFCRRFFEDAGKVIKSKYIDTGKVLFVYKDLPLQFHPMAETYAQAARCAGDQSKYWEMHDKIFTEQAKQGNGTVSVTVDDVKRWATELGLNASNFDSCLDSGKYKPIIQSNIRDGTAAGVNGTPSFLVGKKGGTGQLIVGAQPSATFEAAIEAFLK